MIMTNRKENLPFYMQDSPFITSIADIPVCLNGSSCCGFGYQPKKSFPFRKEKRYLSEEDVTNDDLLTLWESTWYGSNCQMKTTQIKKNNLHLSFTSNSSSSSFMGALNHILSLSKHSSNEVSFDDEDEDGYDNLMPPLPDDYIDPAVLM